MYTLLQRLHVGSRERFPVAQTNQYLPCLNKSRPALRIIHKKALPICGVGLGGCQDIPNESIIAQEIL